MTGCAGAGIQSGWQRAPSTSSRRPPQTCGTDCPRQNNDFAIAEEVTVVMTNSKRPDLVVYVNGIALAVLELKRSTISVSEGIRQNLTNQKEHFIEGFFTTVQFCMAGNTSEGLRYGTILTPEKKYLEWKEDGFEHQLDEVSLNDLDIAEVCAGLEEKLDRQLYAMFQKKRFLDLIHNYVIFAVLRHQAGAEPHHPREKGRHHLAYPGQRQIAHDGVAV